ncbi:MAG: hypothetical protein HY315_08575 [Acidobacteria bacterium]|nr:hypothetical protein [Acidobacteriota bacterium]
MTDPGSPLRFYIEYDAQLVEEAVLGRAEGHSEEGAFRRARNRIYQVSDCERREREFRDFHAEWFDRLKLGHPIAAALNEQPSLRQQTRFCRILCAKSSKEEGADLHRARGAQPVSVTGADTVILIKLKPETLLDPLGLRTLLRHELMHIADMLDPGFGYQPLLPQSEAGPTYDSLVRERYRVLWDTWIDGRLLRRGRLGEAIRERRRVDFLTTFPMCGQEAEEKFRQVFDSDSQTHAGLMAFALDPGIAGDRSQAGAPRAQQCPLCRFPSFNLIDGRVDLSADALEEIALDFPNWLPEHGLCGQCADLYRERKTSRAAEAVLPRI